MCLPDAFLDSLVVDNFLRVLTDLSLKPLRYIEENYSKIRDVEKELTNLNLEMKLTAGPKKAG